MLEDVGRGRPGNRRGNDDAEPSDLGGRGNTEKRAGSVDERPARKPVVHRRGRSQHLLYRPAPAGWQGPAITEMIPALAVTELLHDRAMAIATLPTRGVFWLTGIGVALNPGT